MNAPFAAPQLTDPIVLRVLAGRQRGAEHRLPAGKLIRIGHAFDHDIVLRDPSTRGLSLTLHLEGPIATVSVIAGAIDLLGRPVTAGEEVALPAFVPLHIGALAIAVGDARSTRWEEVELLAARVSEARSGDSAPVPRADPLERLSTRLDPLRDTVALGRRWPIYGLAAAALALAGLAATPLTRFIQSETASASSAEATLRAAGFTGLTVRDGLAGSGPLIKGMVKDDAELARLRLMVADQIGRATIDVDTMQALAASATDILRAQGVDAEARAMRGGAILVSSEFLPADRQDELARLIVRDLPGVKRVAFASDGARGDRDLQYFFSGSAYGLATFVDGDPGHIVTADGTFWFAGAQVPTGHKIIAIGHGRASFERDGRVEELVLGPPGAPAPAVRLPGPPQGRTPS